MLFYGMSSRNGAVHVATTRRTYKGKTYESHLLRRSYREGGKVLHETLGNLSHLPPQTIDIVRRSLRGELFVAATERLEIVRSLPHGHVVAVLGALRAQGLDKLLGPEPCRERDLAVAMIAARVLDPRSKLATTRAWPQSTLAEQLHVSDADEDELYAAMDWLLERQERVENGLAKRHLSEGSLVLYDLTSTYFEGHTCPLAKLGYSRDGKRGLGQIVFGLLTDARGCPVAVEVFAGNTGDPSTVASQVHKLRKRFKLQSVIVAGDRGMLTAARIREDLRPAGLSWITALRAPSIDALRAAGSLQLSLFDEQDLGEITDPAYPDERLVVCRNPLLAEERSRKRGELLACTERDLERIRAQVATGKLRGEKAIGLRVGRVIERFKMAKHFVLHIEASSFRFERDSAQIAHEAALDGFYVLRTNVAKAQLDTEAVVRSYKALSHVERAFRSIKTVDLHVRPIHHRSEERVRAHVFLCMLAYYVQWHMQQAWAPMLFADEFPPGRRGKSPVTPAKRSAAAEEKALSKRRPDGQPVHSFRTLLDDLATLVRNRVRPAGTDDASSFELCTIPTSLQREALDRLGISGRL
jgi:transposase